ncbi:hypothetical protein BOTBODRAFT_29904 [Botryobasidium botryosum FD-172 SS1]|uniref:Phosphatidic acid phosphatase type 2/haloperoxidase domain-containing protein n=1 Tax=Botryobasidium botryosum (strain FD-172 SS1) TaxID=930990 RepID=A0A067N1U9_BOTB1|nr:hypothetical protein BOTBODRAFT_29904 [Botryobasidium botryosum FD-172 SS1]
MDSARHWLFAVLEHSNIVIIVSTGAAILYTKSPTFAYFGFGGLACSLSAKAVKLLLKQARPANSQRLSYGMPSTHSSTSAYFATVVTLCSLLRPFHDSLLPRGVTDADIPFYVRLIPPAVMTSLGALVTLSRVWLGHHTYEQVGGGWVFGLLFGALWWNIWTNLGM